MLDLKKPLQTRDGREVKIFIMDDAPNGMGIVGIISGKINTCAEGSWFMSYWTKEGIPTNESFLPFSDSSKDYASLINVPEKPKKHKVWVNIYPISTYIYRTVYCYPSRESADKNHDVDRIACVEVEFEEGEGL